MNLDLTPSELETLEKIRAELLFDSVQDVLKHLIEMERQALEGREAFPYKLFQL